MCPPHGIMGRLCRHVTIFYCSLPESVHQHKADITIELNAFHKYMFSSCWLISWPFAIKKRNVSAYKANLLLYSYLPKRYLFSPKYLFLMILWPFCDFR